MRLRGRVLTIAGSDSSGGAGAQADIKTITALGGYALSVLTAITVQDTIRVHDVVPLPPSLVAAQLACVLADPGADAIKTGMLVNAATIHAIAAVLARQSPSLPLIVDPVVLSSSGRALLDPDGVAALSTLYPAATLLTPNAPEAALLCGHPVETLDDMRRAAGYLIGRGVRAVLLKGGHLPTDPVTDLLVTTQGETRYTHPRHATRHTHGTGCTLASAIATGLAQGCPLDQAVAAAIAYVQRAIAAAPGFGAGHGPLNHTPDASAAA
jgi:hydroxymethylpyrimidine/phosphomethylpyrimidine kinase